jgi:hypothetical protein
MTKFNKPSLIQCNVRGVIKTKPEYACKFVIFVIQELLRQEQKFRWHLSTNFILINFLSENLLTEQIVCNPYRFWSCFLLHFVVSLVKASLKALEMPFFYRKGVQYLAFGKACSRDGFMFDKPKKNTSCERKIIKKR